MNSSKNMEADCFKTYKWPIFSNFWPDEVQFCASLTCFSELSYIAKTLILYCVLKKEQLYLHKWTFENLFRWNVATIKEQNVDRRCESTVAAWQSALSGAAPRRRKNAHISTSEGQPINYPTTFVGHVIITLLLSKGYGIGAYLGRALLRKGDFRIDLKS